VAALGLPEGSPLTGGFGDLADIQTWAMPYVSACVRDGIMTGANGLLRPNDTITRAEAAAMLVRALGHTPVDGGIRAVYADGDSVPDWAAGYVGRVTISRLMTGKPGNLFDPAGTLTRAEAVTVLSRAVDMN